MKKKVWLRMAFVFVLLLSFLVGNPVQAAGVSLSEGTYTVGKEIPAGLNKFTVSSGEVIIEIYRNQELLFGEYLDSEKFYSANQININLKAGDEVDVYFEEGTPKLVAEKYARADLTSVTGGYYEAGTDIPAGTYSINFDRPADSTDSIYMEIYDSKYNFKSEVDISAGDKPKELKLASGDKIYVYGLIGTMSFKQKIITPSSITISKASLQITPNQTYKVSASVSPSNAIDKTVVWKSSNAKVATVDASGNIKGIANGSATITATAKGNSKVTKTVSVKVAAKTVKLNKTSLSVIIGKTGTLTATVAPADSKDKTVSWKSSNTKIATVDSKGKVTGKAKGTVTITASVKSGKSATAKVTVTSPVAAKSVKMNKSSATVAKGKTLTLSATVSPSNTTDKTVKWKSSNTKVAKVDSKGKVTAVGAGTAKITATTTNGKATTANITVPYSKTLSTGTWKGGTHLPAGRYKITTSSGSGNLVIGMGTDRFVNEILSNENDNWSVTAVTTDIKSGDKIEISGLNSVQFTKVSNVKSNTLHAGHWTVGKDINAGRYKMTSPSGSGNLIIFRGSSLLVNEILSNKPSQYEVGSVTTTLKNGDKIDISGLNKVVFTKK
ncbi:Ig-like domain-containing protein [Planomicrobium sp. CPCC 101079]|uniref:Ig-like domain-containing protein n=1 Tax=Planomicrobium sp. CPCC 101079 TaxID=2599618 RepID=UPI001644F3B3|nr:Ig-like domain-containing protein [Planomicrobium sp. CPCC 101079]